jgi:hypothetical protein
MNYRMNWKRLDRVGVRYSSETIDCMVTVEETQAVRDHSKINFTWKLKYVISKAI